MSGNIDKRLADLGINLPKAASSVANYVPSASSGGLVFISGQLPFSQGKLELIGKVGVELSTKRGIEAARLCALNILAQLKAACGDDLDRVVRVIKLGGFINSAPDFKDQALVMNGASDVMVDVFGNNGRHTRTSVSAPALPLGVAVEIDAIFEVRPQGTATW